MSIRSSIENFTSQSLESGKLSTTGEVTVSARSWKLRLRARRDGVWSGGRNRRCAVDVGRGAVCARAQEQPPSSQLRLRSRGTVCATWSPRLRLPIDAAPRLTEKSASAMPGMGYAAQKSLQVTSFATGPNLVPMLHIADSERRPVKAKIVLCAKSLLALFVVMSLHFCTGS